MLYAYCNVEVWRCSAEYQDVDEPSWHVIQEAKPTARQLKASAAAVGKHGTRGNFLPWADLSRSGGRGVARFSFPFVGVTTPEEVYIWDVRTGAPVQAMLNIQQLNYIDGDDDDDESWCLGEVSDINLTDRYVFVCGTVSLRIFDRSIRGVVGMGCERAVSVEDISPYNVLGNWCFTVATDDSGEAIQRSHIEGALVVEHETVLMGARYDGNVKFLAGECLDGYAIDDFCGAPLPQPLSHGFVSDDYSLYLVLRFPCGNSTIGLQNTHQTILQRWLRRPHPVRMEYVRDRPFAIRSQ